MEVTPVELPDTELDSSVVVPPDPDQEVMEHAPVVENHTQELGEAVETEKVEESTSEQPDLETVVLEEEPPLPPEPPKTSTSTASSDENADTSVETNDVSIKETSTIAEESTDGENPDRTTESPTTGDNNNSLSGMKCVYCNQILTATDEPKLLECLHSACGACIKSKINEQRQLELDNATSSTKGKYLNIFYLLLPIYYLKKI